ncbi:hypothetical protein [Sphaerisporangium dianthi]|uniref:Uncharacterized protein n=1 Tax=Sphaerisporangium dianthi TaxID=1436120 RepID=A0ABV9CGC5_9ACTN
MSSSPAPLEPFAAVQRIRYTVWCVGLSLGLLITSALPWLRQSSPWSAGAVLSLWELPDSGVRAVSEHGVSALGMLLLAVSLTLLTALHPARPMVLGALLAAVLSFLNIMWLHQALAEGRGRPAGIPASFSAAPGVAAALAETLALVLGLGLLALLDSADERDAVRRAAVPAGERRPASPWSAEIGRRLGHAARGGTVSLLLVIGSTLPWVRLRHGRENGEDVFRYLSLWDLAGSSAGASVTPAAETALSLLMVSFLLLLLVASEPDRFVGCWVLLSVCLTSASLWWLARAVHGLERAPDAVEVRTLPGQVVTVVVLALAAAMVVAVILPRGRPAPRLLARWRRGRAPTGADDTSVTPGRQE